MHEKNQRLRKENQAVGFLGQYAIGEGENIDRVKKATKTSSHANKDLAHATIEILNCPISPKSQSGQIIRLKKPGQLKPLPFDIKEADVKY